MSLIVIVPSRGRPAKARECYDAFMATALLPSTKMVFVVDTDDGTFADYVGAKLPIVSYEHEGGGMGPPLNAAVKDLAPHHSIVGFVGDDHRFRTDGWDIEMTRCLDHKPGFAYGNDLARHDIPTQVFVSVPIVLALGWMSLPGARHLYLDNTWATLGSGADCLSYLPDVVIEHMHPIYGKAEMDEGYARVNAGPMYEHDAAVFNLWVSSGQAERDVATVKAAL